MKKIPLFVTILVTGAFAIVLVGSAFGATDDTWNNGSTDWNLGTNWSLGSSAGSGNIAVIGSFEGNQTVNLNGNQTVSGVRFSQTGNGTATISPGTPSVSTLTVGADGLSVSSGSGVRAIGANVILSANQTWQNNAASQLQVGTGHTINNAGFFITVNGSGTVNVAGATSGGGGIVKNGSNTLTLSVANSFSGGVSLNSGTLRLGDNQALGTGILTIGAGTALGTQSTQTLNNIANSISVTGNFSFSSGGAGTLTLTGDMNLNGATRMITQNEATVRSINGVVSNGGIVKAGTGTLSLGGINTYTGNTTVSAGTLILADNSQSTFTIGASGVNNQLAGNGTIMLDGDFTFDLTGAGTTLGNSWDIVHIATLIETFGSTFTVNNFFSVNSSLWAKSIGGGKFYNFDETTGLLSVTTVPEPATWGLLVLGLSVTMILRRRKIG